MLYDPFNIQTSDRDPAILWAREMLKQDFVILDTETTGLRSDDEAVSIAVIDKSGGVLLDTLLCHTKPCEPGALSVHGHIWEATREAPTFVEVWPRLVEVTQDRPLVIYNAPFDVRIIEQMMRRYEIDAEPVFRRDATCAMEAFSRFYGKWSDYHGNYRWLKLAEAAQHFGLDIGGAHGAVADCLLTLGVIRGMAAAEMHDEP